MDTARQLIRGQGRGPLATDRHRQGAEAAEKSQRHTNNGTHIHTYSPLLSFCCLQLPHQGKACARQGYATLVCQLPLLSTSVLFSCLCYYIFTSFLFSFLASVALLLELVHAVSPSMKKRHPIAPDGPPTSPSYSPFIKVDLVTVFEKKEAFPTKQLCTNTFWSCCDFFFSIPALQAQVRIYIIKSF